MKLMLKGYTRNNEEKALGYVCQYEKSLNPENAYFGKLIKKENNKECDNP